MFQSLCLLDKKPYIDWYSCVNCRSSRRSCSLLSMWQYQRPEEDSDEALAPYKMDTSTSVAKQAQSLYHKRHLLERNGPSLNEAKEFLDKLYRRVYSLLFVVVVSGRHSNMTQHIIQTSIENLDSFNADHAAKAFSKLEMFARNLINNPWKEGFKRIKIYSGFLKLHIERHLKGTKAIFEALGYRKDKDELVLKKDVGQKDKESVALDCYIAHVEMQIFKELFNKVSVLGYSYMDVYRSRQHCIDDLSSCEEWIKSHCKPRPRIPVETEYIGASITPKTSPEAQVRYPPTDSFSKQEETADIYSPSARRSKHTSIVSFEDRPKNMATVVDKSRHSAAEGSDKILYATGTFDDHMKESMRILKDDKASPRVAPPSYETSSLYPSDKNSEDEWGDVREKIKNMGSQYADPGGRGDIISPDKRNKTTVETKQPAPVKPTESSSSAFQQIPSIHPRPPIGCGTVAMPKQRMKQFGRTDLVVDCDAESPNKSPTGVGEVSSDKLIANIQSSTAYTTARDRQPDFSTFRATDMDSQNTQYLTKLAVPTSKPKQMLNGQKGISETDGGESDEYVSLRETNTGTADLRHGKPSYQENFQKTTARFYQHESDIHSLPVFDNRKKNKVSENGILKCGPSRSLSMWECGKCTYANSLQDGLCEMCGTSRVKGAEQKPLRSGGAQCTVCTLVNPRGNDTCSACGHRLKGSPTYI